VWGLLAAPVAGVAQQPAVHARLELRGGKTEFRVGEPIELKLVFSGADPRYGIKNEADWSAYDEIRLTSPAPVFRWKEANEPQSSDMLWAAPLGDKGVTTTIWLDQAFAFTQPGTYTVTVTTSRLYTSEGRPTGIKLTTNPVEFHLSPMSAQEEEQRVKTLVGEIDTLQDDVARQRAAIELSTLRGDTAAREKVRLFSYRDQAFRNSCCYVCTPIDDAIEVGLALSQNKELEIQLLDEAWKSPAMAPDERFLSKMMLLKRLDAGVAVAGSKSGNVFYLSAEDIDWSSSATPGKETEDEARYRQSLEEIVATLPQRSGQNRADTAKFLFDRMMPATLMAKVGPGWSSQEWEAVRRIVIEEFDLYRPDEKSDMLKSQWEALKGPAMIAPLEAMCSLGTDKAAMQRMLDAADPMWRNDLRVHIEESTDVALVRLMQLDAEQGRPYLLAALQRDLPAADAAQVATKGALQAQLDAGFAAVIERLANGNEQDRRPMRRWAMWAAQYASPAIYEALLEVYERSGPAWFPEERGELLAYLMRWNPERAMGLVMQEGAGTRMCLLQSMGQGYSRMGEPYPAVLRAYLRGVVERDTDGMAASAAYQLARHGTAEDAGVLRARLAAVEAEWRPKAELLSAGTRDASARDAMRLEQMLIGALRQQVFALSPGELAGLKAECVGEFCARLTTGALTAEAYGPSMAWPTLNDYR
jgi:hypothetical protein